MNQPPLSHDATASKKGTVYELYITVQKCFEMVSGQKVIIERYGDVTVSASQQLEIKHYDEPLTDSHINLWKTLKNWMQDGFDESAYAALLLCTTQEFGPESLLKEWNANDVNERLAILTNIQTAAEARELSRQTKQKSDHTKPPESLLLQRWVMDPTRAEKLTRVVERFMIADLSPDMQELYERLKDIYGKGILLAKRDDFLEALLGFVICPEVVVEGGWEITYDQFASKVEELMAQYHKGTTIFPVKNLLGRDELSAEVVETKKDALFVRKIRDIEYDEVVSKAIADHFYASETVLKELGAYEVPVSQYQVFSRNVLDQFQPHYRKASRTVTEVVKQSQDFYDEVMMEQCPSFPGFENPPLSFRNGVLHMHCDDDSQDIKWRLELT